MLSKTLIQCTCIAAAILPAFAGTATLSNIALPRDQSGQQIITGEASAMAHDGAYYFYFNNWGECPGVNCCASPAGCATCCFTNFPNYTKGCASPTNGSDPYGSWHTVQGYKTTDFKTWTNMGTALPLTDRNPGTEFRPCVVYNPKTKLFLMWYEDRGIGETGYAVATSPTPEGPFTPSKVNIVMPGRGRTGDYNIFVDDDGAAYHVRTGFDVVKLNDAFDGPAEHVSAFQTPKASEGIDMERALRQGLTKAIGVSNFGVDLLKQLIADKRTTIVPAANQCNHAISGGDDGTFDFCKKQGISYSAFSPLEGLSGKDVFKIPQVIAIGKAHNVSAAQVALKWVVQQNITAVTAASNPVYISEDISLWGFELTAEEMQTLAAI
eukprot:gene4917-10532_t